MRFTIERLRTLVLVAGALLIAALVGFLALGHWRNRFNLKEIPQRLGADIQREANGFTYTQSHGGHTLFKIHASRVVQLKLGGRAQLHDVQIELYGEDGTTVDRISGGEFDWDDKAKKATAAGPVEITIMRPGVAPAVAHGVHAQPPAAKSKSTPLGSAASTAASGQIDVKTSGLTFDEQTGIATTAARVEFSVAQGDGSSLGATFDSDKGELILDRDVQLNVRHGKEPVVLRAQHGEFQRDELTCDLIGAAAGYRNGQASAGQAHILFRQDGSAQRLEARDGFSLTGTTGARVAAPSGSLDFNERNQPTRGDMEGGVTMESSSPGRTTSGSAPTAQLAFTSRGELRHAHLERGVILHSEQQGTAHLVRDWRSPVADIEFRSAAHGQLQMASVRGTGGVTITGQAQRPGGSVLPSRMSADQVTGEFGAHQELKRIVGVGHASLEQTTAAGAHQVTSGDRLEAMLAPAGAAPSKGKSSQSDAAQQIQSATVDGNVLLTQQQPAKPGETPPPAMTANAGHAVYEGAGEWLHLTGNPRVDDGGLQLTADKLDVSQSSGDAFARGNVKATWLNANIAKVGSSGPDSIAQGRIGLGGQGPAHVVAAEARLHQATGEATFRGQARLWQQANSISAPEIVLDRARQTLVARGAASQPVNLVLLSGGEQSRKRTAGKQPKAAGPSVLQVWAGDVKYSGAERRAILHAGAAGSVTAETASATTSSNEAEIVLLPPGNHAAPDGGSAQVDRLTARGRVVITSEGRRGTGEQLVYSSETGDYVLTGTAAAPPRMTDPVHGSVTGEALIFNSRDDSVSIEGHGQKTQTQTVAPK
ncbi:MAG TPA: LptA/OstA family protein [Terracidiphilus sp.]|nr:LptA/OstA family protein [Terracidiphilus sp.]